MTTTTAGASAAGVIGTVGALSAVGTVGGACTGAGAGTAVGGGVGGGAVAFFRVKMDGIIPFSPGPARPIPHRRNCC